MCATKLSGRSFGFAPDNVFVVPPIDKRIDFSVVAGAKEDATFDAFAEENVTRFGQELFSFSIAFDKQFSAVGSHRSRLARRQFVNACEIGKPFRIAFADCRIFVIPEGLRSDDLPDSIAPQPGVGLVVTGFEVLSENGFGFVSVVTQDGDRRGCDSLLWRS